MKTRSSYETDVYINAINKTCCHTARIEARVSVEENNIINNQFKLAIIIDCLDCTLSLPNMIIWNQALYFLQRLLHHCWANVMDSPNSYTWQHLLYMYSLLLYKLLTSPFLSMHLDLLEFCVEGKQGYRQYEKSIDKLPYMQSNVSLTILLCYMLSLLDTLNPL